MTFQETIDELMAMVYRVVPEKSVSQIVVCPDCDGERETARHGSADETSPCPTCRGKGWVWRRA